LAWGFDVLTQNIPAANGCMPIWGTGEERVLGGFLGSETRVARLRMLKFQNQMVEFTSVEGSRYLECGLRAELFLLFIYCYLLYKW